MAIAYMLIILSAVYELVFFSTDLIVKKATALILLGCVLLSNLYLLIRVPNVVILLVFLISLCRGVNILRALKGRMHDRYLQAATGRTSSVLMSAQAIILIVYAIFMIYSSFGFLMHLVLWIVLALEAIAALVVFGSIRRNIRNTTPPSLGKEDYQDLPTISVCIPARNEDNDLSECLDALLQSDYPKLEILVLDDLSSNRRTPEVIRSYAQQGVVFVPGTQPPNYWLAKNWAYDQMARLANGELIVFCGVDLRLSRKTLSSIVATMQSQKMEMISVIPKLLNLSSNPFIQPMRYWWELALPRNFLKRPPVIGTFWAINNATFKKLGGFKSTRRMITPEAFFAKGLSAVNKYRFYRDNDVFGIASNKPADEQASTAIRLRYPQLHKRPEVVMSFTIIMFILAVIPFAGFLVLWLFNVPAALVSAIIVLLYIISYRKLIKAVGLPKAPSEALVFPLAIVIDMLVVNLSMYRYEFSKVEWKGRDITIPVMHTTSSNTRSRR